MSVYEPTRSSNAEGMVLSLDMGFEIALTLSQIIEAVKSQPNIILKNVANLFPVLNNKKEFFLVSLRTGRQGIFVCLKDKVHLSRYTVGECRLIVPQIVWEEEN